jgi:phosphatidylglycerol---prolipoprotein diacylglyceryl transferase
MHPVLFRVGKITVWSYPAMLFLGLLAGVVAGTVLAHAAGTDAFRAYVATLILFLPALIGAKLLYVISHWQSYRTDWKQIWRSGEGGGAMYGGLLVVLPVSIPVLAALRLPTGTYWDIAVFTMLVAMVVARVGCVMNGCCAGRRSKSFFSMYLPNRKGVWERRVPTQFLEAGLGVALVALALTLRRYMPFPGSLFLLVTAGYALGRLALESTREQTRRGGFTIHHGISILLIVTCVGTLAMRWPR